MPYSFFKKFSLLVSSILFLCSCGFEDSESELCFIGDSITFQWDIESFFPGYRLTKHAVNGAKIQHTYNWNVSDCQNKPIVFLMGTNNIGGLNPKEENITEALETFTNTVYLPRAQSLKGDPLIVVSILPRNYLGKQDTAINQVIELQNSMIRKGLDSIQLDYIYVNAFYDFLETDYSINEQLFRDGLHPSPEGYEILGKRIQDKL